jgi:ATP/maltotriose-dependent transcriptional regulator MalT
MTVLPGPPEPPPYRVARPRLEATVADLLRRPLTLLIAGPGFGKTTLAAIATRERRCGWFSLEDAEPDLPLLVRRAANALAPHLPGWSPRLLTAARPAVEREDAYRATSIAGTLCEEVGERLTGELVLVIDGVPALRPDGPASAFLEALCRQAPAGLHLLLTSRAEPAFPLRRMRSAGLVGTLTTPHLAFTEDEALTVVGNALPGADPALARLLHGVTAGWPVRCCRTSRRRCSAAPTTWSRRRSGGSPRSSRCPPSSAPRRASPARRTRWTGWPSAGW